MDEVWKPIPGFPGYFVSSDGHVASEHGQGNRVWAPRHSMKPRSVKGYLQVKLHLMKNGKSTPVFRQVHHLVLDAFVGPRPLGSECRHLNDVRTDNTAANLQWGTTVENRADQRRNGGALDGEKNPSRKLSSTEVQQIRSLRGYVTQKELSRRFSVSQRTISSIQCFKSWTSEKGNVI
jgi:hypothetical protein